MPALKSGAHQTARGDVAGRTKRLLRGETRLKELEFLFWVPQLEVLSPEHIIASTTMVARIKKWWRLILCLAIIIILPLPNVFADKTYKPSIVKVTSTSTATTSTFSLPKDSTISSASILGRLFSLVGQEYKAPAISVCLINRSVPIPPGVQLGTTTALTDEVGAFSFKVRNLSTQETTEIYAKVGSTSCQTFPDGQLQVVDSNDTQFNNIEIVAVDKKGKELMTVSLVDFGDTQINVSVQFDWKMYLYDMIITSLILGLVIELYTTLYRFCFGVNEG